MSGILDNKQRVLDTIITLEGRKQLAFGGLEISYASFTDVSTFYSADVNSGSSDVTQRIYLESCLLPQDEITFKSDDSGRLMPFGNDKNLQLKAGQLLNYSFQPTTSSFITGSNTTVNVLRGDEFSSHLSEVLASSANNFAKLRIIGTHDDVFDDGFAVGPNTIEFLVSDDKPLKSNKKLMSINSFESLFNDPRLSNLKNFQYLPPIIRTDDNSIDKSDYKNLSSQALGKYPPWGVTHLVQINQKLISDELLAFEKMGYVKTINFEPTSKQNNVMCQFFEINFDVANKLDIIDFGVLSGENPMHVFFVGKLLVNNNGSQTFIHVFTMVFE